MTPREEGKHRRKSLWSRLKTYLFAGILVTAPAFITIYTTVGLMHVVDRWVKSLLPDRFYPDMRIFGVPGIGLGFLLALLIAVGFMTANWFGKAFMAITDKLFARTPVLSSLYTTLKQLFHTFLGENTTSFRQVVYVEFPREGCWSIGFVTGACAADAQSLGEDMIHVFVPTTPNPTSGFLVLVPRARIRKSEMSVEQGLKAVVSMGITNSGDAPLPNEPPAH